LTFLEAFSPARLQLINTGGFEYRYIFKGIDVIYIQLNAINILFTNH
jgi:hypothetical protein